MPTATAKNPSPVPPPALNEQLQALLPDWEAADIDSLAGDIDDMIANGEAEEDIVASLISDYDVGGDRQPDSG